MEPIITLDRITAAANINRWRGWTKRPYSILEHMVIGTEAMEACGYPVSAQRMFLLHDMHETEIIGDVPTPDKRAYCNDTFHLDCEKFDADMYRLLGWSFTDADYMACRYVDNQMLIVENRYIASRGDKTLPQVDENNDIQVAICDRIIWTPREDMTARFARNYLRVSAQNV